MYLAASIEAELCRNLDTGDSAIQETGSIYALE
jgi:hypothetical protein